MSRDRVLRIVLVLVGVLFVAALVPIVGGIQDPAHSDTGDTMMMGLYATLGVFLLFAARNPARYRSVIGFAAWSNLAHAAVMTTLGFRIPSEKDGFILGSAVLVVIAVLLLALLGPSEGATAAPQGKSVRGQNENAPGESATAT